MSNRSIIHSRIVTVGTDSNISDGMMLGYEGDASDAEDDAVASAVSTGSCNSTRFPELQMALLDFWLILRQELDKVHVFFQTRFLNFYRVIIAKHAYAMTISSVYL